MRAPLQVCSDMRLKRFVAPLMIGLLMGVGQEAMADDWGCQVLLCLSDPRGATTEAQCRPPIEKLWKHLRRGKPFPTCAMAGSAASRTGSYAVQSQDYFDPCPEGTTVSRDSLVALAPPAGQQPRVQRSGNGQADQDGKLLPRACVGKVVGSIVDSTGSTNQITHVYDRIEWQQPQVSRAIDVYVDGQLNRRVRY